MSEERQERDFSAREPVFGPEVHPKVARECLETWRQGKPWTRIRVLEKGVDDPSGQSCANSQGKFHLPCSKKIEAVQYTSAQAGPMFFCEEHALEQNDWDNLLYWNEHQIPDRPELTPEEQKHLDKLLGRKKQKDPEPEEDFDL